MNIEKDINIELLSLDEISEKVTLKIKTADIDEKLDEILRDAVTNFKHILENTFKEYENRLIEFEHKNFDSKKVKIFQAGNASKNVKLQSIFEDVFKDHPKIVFLESDENTEERKKITPKNAVARGLLFLSNVGYHYHQKDDKGGLDRYIWLYEEIEEEGDEAEAVLKKGDTAKNTDFSIVSRVDINIWQFKIFYSDIATLEDEDDDHLKSLVVDLPEELQMEDLYLVHAKPYYDKYLEIKLGDDEETFQNSYILDLDNGNLTEWKE